MKWKSSPAELYGLSHINYNVNVCVLSLKGPTLFMPQGLLSNNYNTLTTLKGEQDFIWHFLVMYDKVLNLYVILIIIPWPFCCCWCIGLQQYNIPLPEKKYIFIQVLSFSHHLWQKKYLDKIYNLVNCVCTCIKLPPFLIGFGSLN